MVGYDLRHSGWAGGCEEAERAQAGEAEESAVIGDCWSAEKSAHSTLLGWKEEVCGCVEAQSQYVHKRPSPGVACSTGFLGD